MPATSPTDFLHALFRALSSGAVGLFTAIVLIVALGFVLPAGSRSRVRTPFVLLLCHLVVLLLQLFIDPASSLGRALPVLGSFFLLAAIGQAAFLLIVDALLGRRTATPLPRIFRDIVQGLVLIGVVLLTLRAAGVEPGSLLTTSALLTAVIGLSLQDTLGNLFAGLSIQAQRPFEVGDWIQIDPDARFIGRVIEINWRATTVLTADQVELIIPNGTLAKSAIRNFTKPTVMSRRTVEVQAPYDVSPQRAVKALLGAVTSVEGVRVEPSPSVQLRTFGDNGISYALLYFIDDFAARDKIDSEVRQRVWFSFRRDSISFPFPTRSIQTQETQAAMRAVVEADEKARRLQAIKGVDFLAALPPEALERLAALSTRCQYLIGEVILRQGDRGHDFYIVQSGEVVVLLGRPEGSVAEIARLGPGKFFGEMSVMTGERRTATIQATTDCELVRIDKDAFQDILAADPKLIEQITQVLVERQIAMEENIMTRAARTKTDKEAKSNALVAAIRQFFSL
jgi:small-conductance mechanosensitive channel/CRP-like cAMP-binding protein